MAATPHEAGIKIPRLQRTLQSTMIYSKIFKTYCNLGKTKLFLFCVYQALIPIINSGCRVLTPIWIWHAICQIVAQAQWYYLFLIFVCIFLDLCICSLWTEFIIGKCNAIADKLPSILHLLFLILYFYLFVVNELNLRSLL